MNHLHVFSFEKSDKVNCVAYISNTHLSSSALYKGIVIVPKSVNSAWKRILSIVSLALFVKLQFHITISASIPVNFPVVALYSAIGGTESDMGKGVHSIDTGALAEERDPLQRQ